MSDQYEDLANELTAVAEALRGLAGRNLPDLSYLRLDIQPAHGWDNDTAISMVDTIGRALLGKPGETQELSNGTYHHAVDGRRGRLDVSVYRKVDPPEKRALEAELAQLRAEVESARQAKEEHRS